jgi:hypothetical protein
MIKNKKKVLKGDLGYGTKAVAFTDMDHTKTTDFDNLDYMFATDGGTGWCDSDFNVDEILEIIELD